MTVPMSRGPLAPLFDFGVNWLKVLLGRGQQLGVVRTDLPDELLVSLVVAADGGARLALAVGRMPDLVVGDVVRLHGELAWFHPAQDDGVAREGRAH